jgi:hypothetical protein
MESIPFGVLIKSIWRLYGGIPLGFRSGNYVTYGHVLLGFAFFLLLQVSKVNSHKKMLNSTHFHPLIHLHVNFFAGIGAQPDYTTF